MTEREPVIWSGITDELPRSHEGWGLGELEGQMQIALHYGTCVKCKSWIEPGELVRLDFLGGMLCEDCTPNTTSTGASAVTAGDNDNGKATNHGK